MTTRCPYKWLVCNCCAYVSTRRRMCGIAAGYRYRLYQGKSPRRLALSVALPSSSPPFLSTRGGPLRLLLPPPCPPASTAPGEGLHGGPLEGSCDRRRRRHMPNRQNVDAPAYLIRNIKLSYPKAVRQINAATSSNFSAPISVATNASMTMCA